MRSITLNNTTVHLARSMSTDGYLIGSMCGGAGSGYSSNHTAEYGEVTCRRCLEIVPAPPMTPRESPGKAVVVPKESAVVVPKTFWGVIDTGMNTIGSMLLYGGVLGLILGGGALVIKILEYSVMGVIFFSIAVAISGSVGFTALCCYVFLKYVWGSLPHQVRYFLCH